MNVMRRLCTRHRWLAAWLCLAVLALRIAVPGGYMLSASHGQVSLTVCPDAAPVANAGHAHDKVPADHGRSDMPCAFAGLSAPLLGAAAVALPTLLPALTAAQAPWTGVAASLRSPPFLRPPTRGPPALP